MRYIRSLWERFDFRVSLGYLLISILWIFTSDLLVNILFAFSPVLIAQASILKGIFFVLTTAAVLFLILRRELQKLTKLEDSLKVELALRKAQETLEREHRLFAEALRDSLAALTTSVDVQVIMQKLLEHVSRVVPGEGGSIVLFEGNEGRVAYLRGFPAGATEFFEGYRFPITMSNYREAYEEKTSYLIHDTRLDSEWISLPATEWIRSTIGVPIEKQGNVIGVLIADSSQVNTYQAQDLAKLQAFARYAGLALENAYNFSHLEDEVVARTRELNEARKRVEAILNNSNDGVVLADQNLMIQQVNMAFDKQFQSDPDSYFGKSLLKLVAEGDHPAFQRRIENVLQTHSGELIETCGERTDGSRFNAEFSVGYITTNDENRKGLVVTIRDISERKQAEQMLKTKFEEEKQFREYLQILHEVTIELTMIDDLDQFYRRVVELALERFGFERLALFLYDAERNEAVGTYGTDIGGNLIAEHHVRFNPKDGGIMERTFHSNEHFAYDEQAKLFTSLESVSEGWNAGAVLWNGEERLGWLVTDNGVKHRAASNPLLGLLPLYAMSVAAILAQKKIEGSLRQSETKFRSLVEAAPTAIIISNTQGEITLVNHEAEALFGYNRDELIGSSIDQLVPHEIREAHAGKRHQYVSAPTDRRLDHQGELTALRKDGSSFATEIALSYVPHPDMPVVMSFIRDITERKRWEEVLIKSLEREKELNELKSRFVSMASHEFRTPLTAILSSSEILLHFRERLDEEKINRKLNIISLEVKHLTNIIDDVLDLGRMQSGRSEFRPEMTDLDLICRDLIDEFQARLDLKQNIAYSCQQAPMMATVDKRLMRQVIMNLVSNAIKYSPEGKSIYVTLEQTPDTIIMKVRDEGIGIPADDLTHLFEPFHRASNVHRISGTGLGLSITKQAVEMHDGTIEVETQENVGSTFIVQIPRTRADDTVNQPITK